MFTMTEREVKQLHEAAKMIEADGTDAFKAVAEKYGSAMAEALLVAYLRFNVGSTETYPPREEVVENVNVILRQEGILR